MNSKKNKNDKSESAISLIGINKKFASKYANRDINLEIPKSSIYGIIGENGAGKSTLMKILYGTYRPDNGSIRVFNKKVNIESPKDAIKLGIGMVHQHFMLVDSMTVLENVLLGRVDGFSLKNSIKSAKNRISEIARLYKLEVEPDDLISDLSVGVKQRVEIIKALYFGAKIIILDEPSAVLTHQETHQLFSILKHLQNESVTCILITHKLKEIVEITDNVSVMRGGRIIAHFITSKVDVKQLATAMIGQDPVKISSRKKTNFKKNILSLKNITYKDPSGVIRLNNVSLNLNEGEILGVAGVSGNGQTELLQILSGMTNMTSGSLKIKNLTFTHNTPLNASYSRHLGLSHIPEDRIKTAMVADFPAYLNYILGYHKQNSSLLMDTDKIRLSCYDAMDEYNVQPKETEKEIQYFSGGNQQKLIIAREMTHHMNILLAGQPTRGVDVGAISEIHNLLISHRNNGGSILLVSSEIEEILALSDRIIVFCKGAISGEVEGSKADRQQLGLWMMSENQKTN